LKLSNLLFRSDDSSGIGSIKRTNGLRNFLFLLFLKQVLIMKNILTTIIFLLVRVTLPQIFDLVKINLEIKHSMKKVCFSILLLCSFYSSNTFGTVSVRRLNTDSCSLILLKNGDIIQANITQISEAEIKYKRCGKPNDPEMIIRKKGVLSVKTSDGETIYRSPKNDDIPDEDRKPNGLGIAGFILSLLPLYGIGSILGLIFSAIALRKIKKNPEKYKGRGLAMAGFIISIVVISLIIVATVVSI
jgi:hypothetical protein